MLPKFEIFGYVIFAYPLFMGMAWGLGHQVAKKLNSCAKTPLKFLNLYLTGLFLASWAGAKFFYLLTADIEYKAEALSSSDFWLGGGFVFYGGLIFGLAFTLYFAVRTRQPMFKFNALIPALSFGHAVGRIGCFLAGCCYGIPHEGFYSVHMHGGERLPTQLFEAVLLALFGFFASRPTMLAKRDLVFHYFLFYALVRFGLEFWRGDTIRGLWIMGASSSQIVSICLFMSLAVYYGAKARYSGTLTR